MLKKSERLTERVKGVADAVWKDDTYPCHKFDFCPEECSHVGICDFAVRIESLCAYEETRLTPDGIERLRAENKRLRKLVEKLKAGG